MTLSHLQGLYYCKPFRCDFDARACAVVAIIAIESVRRLAVRSSQIGVVNVEFQKHRRKIAQRLQIHDAIYTKFRWDHPQQGRQIAFVYQLRNLRLRLISESLCPSATVVYDGALAEEDAVLSTTLVIVAL